jgi:hypothetical protein
VFGQHYRFLCGGAFSTTGSAIQGAKVAELVDALDLGSSG